MRQKIGHPDEIDFKKADKAQGLRLQARKSARRWRRNGNGPLIGRLSITMGGIIDTPIYFCNTSSF